MLNRQSLDIEYLKNIASALDDLELYFEEMQTSKKSGQAEYITDWLDPLREPSPRTAA